MTSASRDRTAAAAASIVAPRKNVTVVTAGMKVLVAALETRAAPALKAMTKFAWTEMGAIGDDTSAYMSDLVTVTREMLPLLGEALHPLYVRFFCDKFVASFVPRLIGNIYRCRRIGEVGAQQMQLDVGTLKQTLLDLPALGQANATQAYTKLVGAEMHKAEQLLKLVQTPEALLETTIEELHKEGSTGAIDLGKILELNPSIKNEHDIQVGQELVLPGGDQARGVGRKSANKAVASGAYRTHKVRKGDNMEDIAAQKLGSRKRVGEIKKMNANVNPERMRIGTMLKIPLK